MMNAKKGNNTMPPQEITYKPETHGAITAIKIFTADDGHTPMATLAFAFGGTATIEWADAKQREIYASGINAYTLMYDVRDKPLSFKDNIKLSLPPHMTKYLSALTKDGHNGAYGYMKTNYDNFSKRELAEIICEFDRALCPGVIHDAGSNEAHNAYQRIVDNVRHTFLEIERRKA
jgi:hypothetical protein